ncbi:MAG: hypothetical protein H3C35_08875 [Bacteroidetes bacterium]|nr:hypothetical protein [Bacteroidota bacterium]
MFIRGKLFVVALLAASAVQAQTLQELRSPSNEVKQLSKALQRERTPQADHADRLDQTQKGNSKGLSKSSTVFDNPRYFLMNGNQILGNIYDYGGIAPGDGLIRNVNNMVWRGLGDIYQFAPYVAAAVSITEKVKSVAAAPNGDVFIISDNGIVKSNNKGVSWSILDSALTDLKTTSIAVTPGNVVFLGTSQGGVFKKRTDRNGWEITSSNIINRTVRSLFASFTSDTIFLGNSDGMYYSADLGTVWTKLDTNKFSFPLTSICVSKNGIKFIGTSNGGVLKYNSALKSWSQANNGIDSLDYSITKLQADNAGKIYAAAKKNLYISSNNGSSWVKTNLLSNGLLSDISVAGTGEIFVTSYGDGIFKSTDGGNSWTNISSGLSNKYCYSTAALTGQEIFVSTEGTTYFSSNGGSSWVTRRANPIRHIVSDAINDIYARDVNPYDSRVIFGWRPLPEYVDPSSPYMASNPAPDVKPADGKPDSWPSSWYNFEKGQYVWPGYLRQDVPNADLEVLWGMDDRNNSEFPYYPFPNDTLIRGLGVKLECRALQWSNSLAQNCIFFVYTAQNYSERDLDTMYFGMYGDVDIGGGGSPENADDLGFFISPFDTITTTGIPIPLYSRSLVYLWDNDGVGYLNIPTHYNGCKFLESPGNPNDGIDNDADGIYNAARTMRADESQTDGADNDGDWNVNNDDVGIDGVPDTHDEGEGDGIPTAGKRLPDGTLDPLHPGEPHFELTDLDESDQIGLTAFKSWPWTAVYFRDDEVVWNILEKGFNDTIPNLTDINFVYGTGKISLKRKNTDGSIKRFSIALLMGTDLNDLLITARTVQVIYNQNYQFIRPPDKPIVTAVPGDKRVTLYWDSGAEESVDPILGKDFEGYVIYRSTDPQFSDINLITDGFGSPLLYKPLTTSNGKVAKFDIAKRPEPFFEDDTSVTKNGHWDPGERYIDVNANGKYDATLVEDFYKGYSLVPYDQRGVSYYLGDNTGLVHSFIDSNNVINGQMYYYAVVSYDHGDITTYPPTECTKRISIDPVTSQLTYDVNTVGVVPGPRVSGYIPPVLASQNIQHLSGTGTGKLSAQIINDLDVKDGAAYEIQFRDSLLQDKNKIKKLNYVILKTTPVTSQVQLFDTNFVKIGNVNLLRDNYFVVKNSSTGRIYADSVDYVIDTARGLLRRLSGGAMKKDEEYSVTYRYFAQTPSINFANEESNPVFDGLKLFVQDNALVVNQEKSNWVIDKKNLTFKIVTPTIGTPKTAPFDFQIQFTSSDTLPNGKYAHPGDTVFNLSKQKVVQTPFIFKNITKDSVRANLPFSVMVKEDNKGNKRWDISEGIVFLTPAPYGSGTNTHSEIRFSYKDSISGTFGGEVFNLITDQPFTSADKFSFSTQGAKYSAALASMGLDQIKVVPNPYVAVNSIEPTDRLPGTTRGSRRIYFEHLPKECTIRIFTVSGELVKELYHSSGLDNGREYWDLLNRDNLGVAYGVYIAHIEAKGVGEKILKFAIIK